MKYNKIITAVFLISFNAVKAMDKLDDIFRNYECLHNEYLSDQETVLKARRRVEFGRDMENRLQEEKKILDEFEKKQQRKSYQKINDFFKQFGKKSKHYFLGIGHSSRSISY
jgi:hypothetical protein